MQFTGRTPGIDEDVFFPDLLDFLIWEDYGLTNDPIEGYFKGLTPTQGELCIEHLRREIDELKEDDLEYQGEEHSRCWVRLPLSRSGSTCSRIWRGRWDHGNGSGSSAWPTGR
jgi:hypothetical protein